MGCLYVVATPIGNLGDLGARARETLVDAGLIAAEDTRITKRLLDRHIIDTPVISFHSNSSPRRLERIVQALDEHAVALESDAGTPPVSDPGARLVRAAREAGHTVAAVPGPSAVTAALAISGFPADRFIFGGFLPRTDAKRRRELERALELGCTAVYFESPHRILAALASVAAVVGDDPICVCREMTKLHEEVFVGSAEHAQERFQPPRGEFVLVLNGGRRSAK